MKRLSALILGAIIILALVIGIYLWNSSEEKPTCNCIYPNTGEYGVIREGKCVVTDCKRRGQ